MPTYAMSRRRFTELVGLGVAGSLARRADAFTRDQTPAPAVAPHAPNDVPPAPLARLDSNENPYGPSPAAREAISRSLDTYGRYPDTAEERMREAIALHHGVGVTQVVLGCGSGEILRMADLAFLPAGKGVVAAEPTFEAVLRYAKVMQADAITVPLTPDFRHDLTKMAGSCTERTGVVYVCNPNNPTGTIVRGGELEPFLKRLGPWTIAVVDEAYHHFVEDPRYRSAMDLVPRFANLVVVRTFSKIYGMAGLRLGYAVASEPVIAAMARHALPSNANAAVLEAALAGLAAPDHATRQRAMFTDTRRRLCAEFEKDGRRYIPSETNFVMVHMGADVELLIRRFTDRRILVGRRFAAMPEWLRVSLGTPQEMQLFVAALRELAPARAAA